MERGEQGHIFLLLQILAVILDLQAIWWNSTHVHYIVCLFVAVDMQ